MWSLTSVVGINLKIWIAFRILLIAWRLTLFLEGNYYPCTSKAKGPWSSFSFRTSCEPLALYMLFVCSGFLLYTSVGFLLSENSGYILKKITPSLFDEEFAFLSCPLEYFCKRKESVSFCLLHRHSNSSRMGK